MPDQIAKLQSSGDAFKVKTDSLIDKVANMLADTTVKSPDTMTVFAKLQPSMTEGRKLATQAINEAKPAVPASVHGSCVGILHPFQPSTIKT